MRSLNQLQVRSRIVLVRSIQPAFIGSAESGSQIGLKNKENSPGPCGPERLKESPLRSKILREGLPSLNPSLWRPIKNHTSKTKLSPTRNDVFLTKTSILRQSQAKLGVGRTLAGLWLALFFHRISKAPKHHGARRDVRSTLIKRKPRKPKKPGVPCPDTSGFLSSVCTVTVQQT